MNHPIIPPVISTDDNHEISNVIHHMNRFILDPDKPKKGQKEENHHIEQCVYLKRVKNLELIFLD